MVATRPSHSRAVVEMKDGQHGQAVHGKAGHEARPLRADDVGAADVTTWTVTMEAAVRVAHASQRHGIGRSGGHESAVVTPAVSKASTSPPRPRRRADRI